MIFSSNTLPFSSESFRMYIPGAKPLMSMVPKSLCCVFTRRPEMSYRLMLSIFAPEGFSMFMILEAGLGLRFLDSGKLLSISVPFFRDGFRKVVFSVIIMIIVLFFREGIMGDNEINFKGLGDLVQKIGSKKRKGADA